MNQRPQGLQAEKAMLGFLQYKQAEGVSPATVFNYERDLKLWLKYLGDMDVGLITSTHLLNVLNYLRTEYVPRRIAGGDDRKLSDKTVYNFYMSISAFFTWACREFELRMGLPFSVPTPVGMGDGNISDLGWYGSHSLMRVQPFDKRRYPVTQE